ncbi:MAG: protein-L-isoaspartate(D-aspartate) O-methyltransferase [Planctomycetaceae bacterium]
MSATHRVAIGCLAIAVSISETAAQKRDVYLGARLKMVREYIERDGVTNPRVLVSMRTVPRHEFVLPRDRRYAYLDSAIAIGYKQTISPPFVVAYMTQTIDPQPTDRVLEIGTGSGYQAAVLSSLVKEVYTIEIVPQLGKAAARRLRRLRYRNVTAKVGDGYKGWKEHAPFDKIIVTCSPDKVPQPLIDQLKEGGKLLIPIGRRYQQVFHLLEKKDGKLTRKKLIPTLFVPMTGVSEGKRKVKPDPANPKVVNGSFEVDANKDGLPDNWHYQRQTKFATTGAPDGKRYVVVENSEPEGRAQLLQGMALDGRRVKRITISVTARYFRVARGPSAHHRPGVLVHFFDSIRKPAGTVGLKTLTGTQDAWMTLSRTVAVPARAREAIIQVGLNGGTGRLEVDDVKLVPAGR